MSFERPNNNEIKVGFKFILSLKEIHNLSGFIDPNRYFVMNPTNENDRYCLEVVQVTDKKIKIKSLLSLDPNLFIVEVVDESIINSPTPNLFNMVSPNLTGTSEDRVTFECNKSTDNLAKLASACDNWDR